ncbi:MAG: hypothetical protein ABI587_04620 [Gemmatimonadales bacterium]
MLPIPACSGLLLTSLLSTWPAPSRVAIELTTLHAATLTTSRGAGDSTDAPYFLVSVLGSHSHASSHLPASGHYRLAENAIVSPTPMEVLLLAPGDSARVVISVLESESAELTTELDGGVATTSGLSQLGRPFLDPASQILGSALNGLRQGGAHWLGSVSLLITNEGGTTWWRRMDCAEECAVLQGLPEGVEGVSLGKPARGVFELTGAGGTFHMQLSLKPME